MSKKRLLPLILAFALVFAAVPAQAATYTCRPASQFGWWVCSWSYGQSKPASSSAPTAQPATVDQSGMAAQVIAETNAERAKYGLKTLVVDADLTAAAQIRAKEIAVSFSHTRPDGTSCFTVSNKAYGENIARGYTYAAKVMAAWMSSEGHRANILRASYGSIGVACVQVNGIYCWVQLFGK
ncbi:MAG: hypothetical protein IJ048_06045 [Clostridia bacterium]|nr:hypothetical protein [Clostridia bacterium]